MSTTTLWLCPDCSLYAQGFDEHERGEAYPQATLDAFNDSARSLGDITPGTLDHDGDCIDPDTGEVDPVEDCEHERVDFTWNRCDACLSPLGGSREAFTLWSD